MNRQDNIKTITVKCYNQPLNYKNAVLFQNSLISDKTRVLFNNSTQFNQTSKAMRIHTQGSEPYNPKQKSYIRSFLKTDEQKLKQQSFKLKSKQQQSNTKAKKYNTVVTSNNANKKSIFKQSTQNQNNLNINSVSNQQPKMVGNFFSNFSKPSRKIQNIKTQPCNYDIGYSVFADNKKYSKQNINHRPHEQGYFLNKPSSRQTYNQMNINHSNSSLINACSKQIKNKSCDRDRILIQTNKNQCLNQIYQNSNLENKLQTTNINKTFLQEKLSNEFYYNKEPSTNPSSFIVQNQNTLQNTSQPASIFQQKNKSPATIIPNQKGKISMKKTNDFFKVTNNNLQKRSKNQYYRKSFKSNIRKTQTDQAFNGGYTSNHFNIHGVNDANSNGNCNNLCIGSNIRAQEKDRKNNRQRFTTANCNYINQKVQNNIKPSANTIVMAEKSRRQETLQNNLSTFVNRYSSNQKKTGESFQKVLNPSNQNNKTSKNNQQPLLLLKNQKKVIKLKTEGDAPSQKKVQVPSYLLERKNQPNIKQPQQSFLKQNQQKRSSQLFSNKQNTHKNNKSYQQNPKQDENSQIPNTISAKIDWKKDLIYMDKIGQGTFGKVYKAKLRQNNSNTFYAVKKVFIDKKYKSRELQIVNELNQANIMKVHNVFVTNQGAEQYLNIVMDYYEKNLYEVIGQCNSNKNIGNNSFLMNDFSQKVLIFQMFKGLSYIHSLNICHRDIKPHNILVKDFQLVLCDFGSAKKLISGQQNLSYICSRCYRAPQLIFGSTKYTTQIDLWSAACVILQILNKVPLFIGQSSLDHLLQVIKIMGTPSKKQVLAMNKDYDISEYDLPMIKRKSLNRLFPRAETSLIDLLNRLLVYDPNERFSAIQALCHPYFDELKKQTGINRLKKHFSRQGMINLFTFSKQEMKLYQNNKRVWQMLAIRQNLQQSWNEAV